MKRGRKKSGQRSLI